MASSAIERFTYRFKSYIYPSIKLCLQNHEGVAATILTCCAIDLVARYRSGDPTRGFNKKKYAEFLSEYFPNSYDSDSFYEFVRSGLMHSVNMEEKYLILCNESSWAIDAHMLKDPRSRKIIINPHVLFRDLKSAFNKYAVQIRDEDSISKLFHIVHRKLPLKKQQTSWRKLKHMKTIINRKVNQ